MIYKILFLVLMLPSLTFGQANDDVAPDIPLESTFTDEVIHLRIDLLVQRSATIQARSDRLTVEQQLLDIDRRDFLVDRDVLQTQLDVHCGGTYDMIKRICEMDQEPLPSEEEDPL